MRFPPLKFMLSMHLSVQKEGSKDLPGQITRGVLQQRRPDPAVTFCQHLLSMPAPYSLTFNYQTTSKWSTTDLQG